MAPRSNRGQLILEVLLMLSMMLGIMYFSVKITNVGRGLYETHRAR
jgi:hypothetical protein